MGFPQVEQYIAYVLASSQFGANLFFEPVCKAVNSLDMDRLASPCFNGKDDQHYRRYQLKNSVAKVSDICDFSHDSQNRSDKENSDVRCQTLRGMKPDFCLASRHEQQNEQARHHTD